MLIKSITIFTLLSLLSYSISKECIWSTYRPGPYFGLRSAQPDSPLFGLMWYYEEKMDSVKSMRHFVEISDNLTKYEWIAHNGCDYGSLEIEDPAMHVNFKVKFFNEKTESGNHWVVKISGLNKKDGGENKGIVFMWYISNPNSKAIIHKENEFGLSYDNEKSIVSGSYINNGTSTDFYLKSFQSVNNTHPVYEGIKYDSEFYLVLDISEDKLYDPNEYIIGELKDVVGNTPNHLIDSADSYRSAGVKKGNLFLQQIFLINEFRFDIHFFDKAYDKEKELEEEVDKMIELKADEFNRKFSYIFDDKNFNNKTNKTNNIQAEKQKAEEKVNLADLNNLKDKFLNKDSFRSKFFSSSINHYQKYNKKAFNPRLTAVSALSTLFSNLIYMSGQLQILNLNSSSVIISNKTELLTIGPDKTSHSRGFMWDEGFQQRILSLWNLESSLIILSNWFSNVDPKTGWLPREQSLDAESRARAPPSSWASIPGLSNPPSLFFFVKHLLERPNLSNEKDNYLIKRFLQKSLNNIEKNANWYLSTQKSKESLINVFAWKGKTDDFCLPSGLDDYPRCRLNGKDFAEGHIDLQSWMISLAKTMVKVYKFLDEEDVFALQIKKWQKINEDLFAALIKNFWDESRMQFDDFYLDENNNKVFCGHTGYLQLFPLILDNFENEDFDGKKIFIEAILNLIVDESHGLKTPYGVRSLSYKDNYYRKGQNYWTSPIWININYLILKKLNEMKNQENFDYLKKEYEIIRNAVVNNMVNNFEENGYIWEVYNDVNGNGMYNHPFTGWSALIVNLIYEMY